MLFFDKAWKNINLFLYENNKAIMNRYLWMFELCPRDSTQFIDNKCPFTGSKHITKSIKSNFLTFVHLLDFYFEPSRLFNIISTNQLTVKYYSKMVLKTSKNRRMYSVGSNQI